MKNPRSNPESKKFVGLAAAQLVQHGMVAGMGTGSTLVFVIEELARRVREDRLKFVGVPTSFQSRILCLKLGIPMRDVQDTASLDLAIDGADEVDDELNLIKGGGGSHTHEKIVAAMAREFVAAVDESKLVSRLGSAFPVPIEVLPPARSYVEHALRDLGGTPTLRTGSGKDGPVVTDNGALIYDVRFAPDADLRAIDNNLHGVPGILETGLFFDMTAKVLVGCSTPNGPTLKTLTRVAQR